MLYNLAKWSNTKKISKLKNISIVLNLRLHSTLLTRSNLINKNALVVSSPHGKGTFLSINICQKCSFSKKKCLLHLGDHSCWTCCRQEPVSQMLTNSFDSSLSLNFYWTLFSLLLWLLSYFFFTTYKDKIEHCLSI